MNVIAGTITAVTELGNRARVTIGPVSAEITVDSLHRLGLEPGPARLRQLQGDRNAYRRQPPNHQWR